MNYSQTEDRLLSVDDMWFGRMIKTAPPKKEILVLCNDWSDCVTSIIRRLPRSFHWGREVAYPEHKCII